MCTVQSVDMYSVHCPRVPRAADLTLTIDMSPAPTKTVSSPSHPAHTTNSPNTAPVPVQMQAQ